MEQSRGAVESGSFVSNLQISGLLSRLTAMAKKPTIECDISQALDDFLEKLNEYDKYLEHGIFNMNFAEAALILQSSADIYGKKVDLLWDIIFDYQKRMLLTDEQNIDKDKEMHKLEERKRKYKRKRKTKEAQQQTSQLVNSFSFGAAEYVDYLNTTLEPHELLIEWEKFTVSPPVRSDINNIAPSTGKDALFLPSTKVHTEDGEYIGRYDQFHSASVLEEMFQLEQPAREQNHIVITRTQACCSDRMLLGKFTPVDVPAQLGTKRSFPEDHTLSPHQTCCKEIFVCLERLPFDLVQEKIRRMSFADSLFDDDNFSSISNTCPSPMGVDHNTRESCDESEFDSISGAIEKRNKSCSQDSAFYELEDEEQMSAYGINTPLPDTSQSHITNTALCCGGSIIIPKPRLVKRSSIIAKLIAEDRKEPPIKKKKVAKKRVISEKQAKKLSTGITANLKEFERFCRLQYKAGENEGEIPPPEPDSSSDEEPEESSDEEDTPEPIPSQTFPDSDHEDDEGNFSTLVESGHNELTPPVLLTPSQVTETPQVSLIERPIFTPAQAEESRKTVREWRDFIVPKLKKMENKSDFDIHEYGSRIMEGSEVGEERDFWSMVQGKGATEVARYFLATLQLATTNNVAIKGAVPGEVANDSFKVETLDKTRYHELLEEYQAPSEETFRDRLQRAKAMNPKVPLHSTPSTSVKKVKMTASSRKKLF